jgi:ligand-binding sensor domain-containing protein/signal transduction histidine kinase
MNTAQISPPSLGTGVWNTYDGSDGLPGSAVCLLHDRQGYLWIGSFRDGLTRFDGQSFKTFTQDHGLPGLRISALIEDTQGQLWVGTDKGLCRRQEECFVPIEGIDQEIEALTPGEDLDAQTGLWVAGTDLFWVANNRTGRQWTLPTTATALQADADGLWVGTENGLYHIGATDLSRYDFSRAIHTAGLEDMTINTLQTSPDGLWIASSEGLYHIADGRLDRWGTDEGLVHTAVRDIYQDPDHGLWIATEGGLSHFDGETFRNFTTENTQGLILNRLRSVLRDSAGDLWIGTIGGLNQYSRTFVTLDISDGLVYNDVRGLFRSRSGDLWIATENGVSCYNGHGFRNWTVQDGLPHHRVFSVIEDRNSHFWIGTEAGLCRWDGGMLTCFTTDDGLPDDEIYTLLEDRDGCIWIGTEAGLCRWDGERFSSFTTRDGLLNDDISSIAQDADGVLWIATEGGLCRYDGEVFTSVGEDKSLIGSKLDSICLDREGHIWLTSLSGILRYDTDTGTITQYGSAQGLAGDKALEIYPDSMGYLWIATWNGLSRYDGQVFQTLTRRDGLGSTFVQSIIEDSQGRLWFATSRGLTCYTRPIASPTPVLIRAVSADRRYPEPVDELAVPFSGLVSLEYEGINLKTRPGAMIYRYRLQRHGTNVEGEDLHKKDRQDTDWHNTHRQRVEYQDLAPGAYTFQVVAVDRDLDYSMPTTLSLEILPDSRDRRIDALEERVRHRTTDLRRKNEELETTLDELRQTQQQLLLQEKTAALGNLVSGLAHELNNPIGALQSAADVARRCAERLDSIFADPSPAANPEKFLGLLRDNLDNVLNSSQRVSALLKSLKNFARLDESELQQADPTAGIDSALTLVQHLLGERITVERDYGSIEPFFCAPAQLNQVFMGILTNAIESIDGPGEILISTSQQDGIFSVSFSDSGRGIPSEIQQRIFDVGFNSSGDRVRMGSSLALAYRIVQEHGGEISLESQVGRGTQILVSLPQRSRRQSD